MDEFGDKEIRKRRKSSTLHVPQKILPKLFDKKKRHSDFSAHQSLMVEPMNGSQTDRSEHRESERMRHLKPLPRLAKTTSLGQVKEFFVPKENNDDSFSANEHDTLQKIQQELKKEETEDVQQEGKLPSERKFYRRFDLPDELVIDSFVCAQILKGTLLAQGTLYITQNYVCFYSSILRRRISVTLQFEDIICIRKCSLLKSIPNSIEIHTPEKKYTWTSFLHRQEAFELMDTRWRNVRKKLGMPIVDHLDPDEVEESLDFDLQLESDVNKDEVFISEKCDHESPKTRDKPPRYTEIFSLSVEEFFYRFISNLSVPFWIEFIAKDGYDMASCTQWDKTTEGCCMEREIVFRTPIRFALSPNSSTKVIQKQRYRFLSPTEFVFETSSYSVDVPYSQQFLVESRWHIKRFNNDDQCELNIAIGVRFTKKIIFKRVIEQTAIEGSRDWFKNWIHFAMNVVAQNDKTLREGSNEDLVVLPPIEIEEKIYEEEKLSSASSFPVLMMVYFLMLGSKLSKLIIILLMSFAIILLGTSLYYYFLSNSLVCTLEETKQHSIHIGEQHDSLVILLQDFGENNPFANNALQQLQTQCELELGNTFIWESGNAEDAFGTLLNGFEQCINRNAQTNE